MVATDGLFKHARSASILKSCASGTVSETANGLIELPRLRSATYPHDVALVVVAPSAVDAA